MDIVTIFLIAAGLAMDAFAVSVASGITIGKARLSHGLKFGLFFGGFQFVMPVIGYFLSRNFAVYIAAFDHWIAFALLSVIGVKMLVESGDSRERGADDEARLLSLKNMVLLAVATSIDALAVGISFAIIDTNIWTASLVIGIVAFVFSVCGIFLGKRLGNLFGRRVEILGGLILIGIGLRILIEHLFF